MTPQQIEASIADLVRTLAKQAGSTYSSVKVDVNIRTDKDDGECIRPEWSCYTPVYGWTEGETFEAAMEKQGDKEARRTELLTRAQELMAQAAALETQPATA